MSTRPDPASISANVWAMVLRSMSASAKLCSDLHWTVRCRSSSTTGPASAVLSFVSKHWEPSPAFPDLLRCQVAGRQGSDWQISTSSARRDQGLTVCSLTLERLSGLDAHPIYHTYAPLRRGLFFWTPNLGSLFRHFAIGASGLRSDQVVGKNGTLRE